MSKYWMLIGSFNPLITTLQFTTSPPSLSFVSQFTSAGAPTWLAHSPKFPTTIYATNETETGSITSLTLNLDTGNLAQLATVPTQGNGPTHLGFINDGAALGAANFGTGSAFFVNLDATGTGQFNGGDSLVPFQGSGPLPSQTGPHAHQVGVVVQYRSLRPSLQTGICFLGGAIRQRDARRRPWFRQDLAPWAGGQHLVNQRLYYPTSWLGPASFGRSWYGLKPSVPRTPIYSKSFHR